MQATLIDNRHIYLSNITQPEEDLVAGRFSIILENYNRFVDPEQRGGWNGIYRRYDSSKQRLARPFLGELKKLCREHDLPLIVCDRRPPWPYHITPPQEIGPDWLPGITLDDYQVQAIRAACSTEIGIYDIPTGGGKSEIMSGIVKSIHCPTAIIAEQLVIIDQIKERLELRKVCEEVGLFYAGKTPTDQLVLIGSIQSLSAPGSIPKPPQESDYRPNPEDFQNDDAGQAAYEMAYIELDKAYQKAIAKYESTMKGFRTRRKRAKYLQSLIGKTEMIMIDECDLCVSSPYKSLFRYWFHGRRRYGFSGTVFDPDKPVDRLIINEHLGSVICTIDRQELVRLKRIVPISFFMIARGDGGSRQEGSTFDIAYRERIIENPQFHNDVKAICDTYPDDGTLILVERDALGEALQATIPGSVFIHGKTSQRRRDEVLAAFERRDLKVVIGGKIVKRGLDLAGGCENLIITTSGKLWSNFNQQIGRAVRRNKRGRGRVFAFFSLDNRYLCDHSRKMLRAVVSMGCQTRVIFRDGHQIDGTQFIASNFQRPGRRRQVSARSRNGR